MSVTSATLILTIANLCLLGLMLAIQRRHAIQTRTEMHEIAALIKADFKEVENSLSSAITEAKHDAEETPEESVRACWNLRNSIVEEVRWLQISIHDLATKRIRDDL